MSSNTPNLGLLKKDPLTDGNDTFNIKTMLNDNWDKIDEAVSAIDEKVTDHSSRLDTAAFADVTLNPGVQIVNSARTSRFSLESIKGQTLVNLAGRLGKADDPSKLVNYQLTSSLEPNGTKITLSSGTGSLAVRPISYKAGKKYILLSDVKNGNITSELFVQAAGGSILEMPAVIKSLDTSKFVTVVTKLAPSTDISSGSLETVFTGTSGQYAWVKNMRAYEISDVEYAAIDKMTSEQLAAKYPYVDSVQPVRNPYAIRYGENLLPPFNEWVLSNNAKLLSHYLLQTTASVDSDISYYEIAAIPNQTYTFSAKVNGRTTVAEMDASGAEINRPYTTDANENRSLTITFTTRVTTVRIRVYSTNKGAGTFTLEKPMLTIGSTAKPFKPREDVVLALLTDLYAEPVTGNNADELFARGGQYFKVKKWNKVAMDGSLPYKFDSAATGFKLVALANDNFLVKSAGPLYVTKYDGSILKGWQSSITTGDYMWFTTTNTNFYLSISNADSGWGDNYTPTADEIKAYFMGWRMRKWDTLDPYEGTGAKAWGTVASGGAALWTSTLPTLPVYGWTPYQLVYQLATPTVEPVTSEGALTLVEGDNQVEVGTGIVVREKANPVYTSDTYKSYNINNFNTTSKLKFLAAKILEVYVNGNRDNWRIEQFVPISATYGKELASLDASRYDPSAAYSVTYLMLDKSPIATFTGAAAANEKALLQDVTSINKRISNAEAVAQHATVGAKSYVDNNFYDKPSMSTGNLVQNSTSRLGLHGWTVISGAWESDGSHTQPRYFKNTGAIASGQAVGIDSAAIKVTAEKEYLLGLDFFTSGFTSPAYIYALVVNAANDSLIFSLQGDENKDWHRKSAVVKIPRGVTSVKIRLQCNGTAASGTRAFARIKFCKAADPYGNPALDYYSNEGDIEALFQSASDGKIKVRNAITGLKGIVTDADGDGVPMFDELVAGIATISTGKPYATGTIYFSTYSAFQTTITGLAFSPDLVVIAYRYQSGTSYANEIAVAFKYANFPSSAGENFNAWAGWFSNNQSNMPSNTNGSYYTPIFTADGVIMTLDTRYFSTISMPTQRMAYWAFKLT